MEALTGTALGGFKLVSPLGSGPTGQTYAAVDSGSAPTAIKVIHPNLSLFTRAEAYWAELRRVGELAHPHVCVASAVDWSKSGRFFLSMDLLEGLSLEETLKRHSRLPAAQALLVVGQVCLALEAAHEEKLVHGALKPRNIFLVPHGEQASGLSTRVLDFATGCLMGAAPLPGIPGSPGVPEPAYLAPEQFGGPASAASDIYSVGVILYELISGRRPFAGGYAELAAAHARTALELPGSIPEGLGDVLRRALAKAPAQRFPSVEALREALESWAASSPAALEEPPLDLFAKEGAGEGVGQGEGEETEQTVKVSVEELSESLTEPEPPLGLQRPPPGAASATAPTAAALVGDIIKNKGQSMPDVKKPKVPQDPELAAIAEKAATPRATKLEASAAQPAAQPAPKPTEAYFDEDEDLVELPLEKSVRAFVSNLLPVTPPPRKAARPGGNGESLEAALEQFVKDAKQLNEALPPPAIDDRRLAELAKVPVVEEPPAPVVVAAAPVAAAPLLVAQPTPKRSGVLLPSLISFVLGGVIIFGAYKLFLEKPGAGSGGGTGSAATGSSATAGSSAAGTGDSMGTATAGTGSAVATTQPAVGSGQPTVAATKVDAGATRPDVAAAAATGTPDAAPSAAVEPTPPPTKVAKKVRKTTPKKEGVTVKPKRTPKVKKTDEPKPKKEKKGKKGGGSDWVDPFSQ